MKGPFSAIPDHRRGIWVLRFLFLVPLVYVGLYIIEVHTYNDVAPLGQISFQFAGSTDRVAAIVEAWRAEGVLHMAGASLGFDYLFLTAYGIALALAGTWVDLRARSAGRTGLATAANLAAWAGLVAALIDGIENARLLRLLGDPASGDPGVVLALAAAKLALIGYALVVWLVGSLMTRRPVRVRPG